MTNNDLKKLGEDLKSRDGMMPVLFVGHGSPMNGIEDNEFSNRWKAMGKEIPLPSAVLCISAHWLTRGTHITAMEKPRTIHDFGGFPDELFQVQYPAPGSPPMAEETRRLVASTQVGLDHDWGLDHGTWSIVRHMYPEANVPVLQLSIDFTKPGEYHYRLAAELGALRRKGVLIIGSGNMVHNLRMVEWSKLNTAEYGYDWALAMNESMKKAIGHRDHKTLIDYDRLGPAAKLAIPTPDHYFPLLYVIGLQQKQEESAIFNDRAIGGSLTMTSVKIG